MDLKELRKDLSLKPRFINLFGKEQYFKDQAVEQIIKTFVKSNSLDFNVSWIRDEKFSDVTSILMQVPFDSDYRVVFITEDAERYSNYVGQFTVIVSLDNSLTKSSLSIDCSRIYGRRLKAFVKSRAKFYGVDLDTADVETFLKSSSNSLYFIDNELFKISLLDDISLKRIKDISESSFNMKLNHFFDAIVKKDSFKTFSTYYELTSNGYTDSQLLGFLAYNFKSLFYLLDVERLDFV